MNDDSVHPTGDGQADEASQGDSPELDSAVPAQLGAQRYVLAAFFATGIAVTYVVGRTLDAIWSRLADNVWLSAHLPIVSRFGEEERYEWSTIVAGILGTFAIIYAYRRDDVRTWTNEVASELSKVSWPTKEEVTNSTVVVVLTSAFATVFLALLDRFWGFVTDLVYKG